MGIEPTRPAWKAGILAIELHPRRTDIILSQKTAAVKIFFEFFGNFHFFAFRFRVTSLKTESRRNFFEILSFRLLTFISLCVIITLKLSTPNR